MLCIARGGSFNKPTLGISPKTKAELTVQPSKALYKSNKLNNHIKRRYNDGSCVLSDVYSKVSSKKIKRNVSRYDD